MITSTKQNTVLTGNNHLIHQLHLKKSFFKNMSFDKAWILLYFMHLARITY